LRQFSLRTEEAYWGWVRQFVIYHGKRHPKEMGETEVREFLTHLAADREVAVSTRNQAFNALIFLYEQVLGRPAGDLSGIPRASRLRMVPVVLSDREIRALLGAMEGTPRTMALLFYGAGLRILECARLRIKDVDFGRRLLTLQDTKGGRAA
jgi:integrase